MAERLRRPATHATGSGRVETSPSRPGRPDTLVCGLAAGQTVSWGVLYYAFSVLLVPMQQDLDWSRTVLVGGFTVAVVISGLLAPAVGRRLDHGSPRVVMGAGSVAGVLLILAWARAGTIGMYYAVWTGLGVVMALVLYEPAFAVIAKWYASRHHCALTTVTLVAGTASFIFQPSPAPWPPSTAGAPPWWSWPPSWRPSPSRCICASCLLQFPGRLLLAPLRTRLEPWRLARLILGLPGVGVVLLLVSGGRPLLWPAVAVLGMSQGLNTLLRITLLVDLYGTARIGTRAGLSATLTVLARALAPLGASA